MRGIYGILFCVVLCIAFGTTATDATTKNATTTKKGFMGITDSDTKDGIILAAIVIGCIAIIVAVSVGIYCCCSRHQSQQNKVLDERYMYPEQGGIQAWSIPQNQARFGELPQLPRDEIKKPTVQRELMMPTTPAQLEAPKQAYHGALQDALAPYLAQASLAMEAAEKGNKRKKNSADGDPTGPLSLYNTPPLGMTSNPISSQPQQFGTTPSMPPGSSAQPYSIRPPQSLQQPNAATSATVQSPYSANATGPMIRAGPRSVTGFPGTSQSYMPHLGPSSSNQPITSSATSQPPAFGYPLSQRSDWSSQNPSPPFESSRSARQLTRMNY